MSEGIPQSDLSFLGKDGVKVPISGYKFGKDGIIVPDDNNSYYIGKNGVIIPKPGYTIGKGGIIIKQQDNLNYNNYNMLNNNKSTFIGTAYNFQYSDMVLMIGGKILAIVLIIMVVLFGTPPLSFPANSVRKMFNKGAMNINKVNA